MKMFYKIHMSVGTKYRLLETYNHQNLQASWLIKNGYVHGVPSLNPHPEGDGAPRRTTPLPRPVAEPDTSSVIRLLCTPASRWGCWPSSNPPHWRSGALGGLGGSHPHLPLLRLSVGMGPPLPASLDPYLQSRRHVLEFR